MMLEDKKYQRLAVEELVKTTSKFLDRDGPGEVCVFQAPTGSGKTVIMAKFIQDFIKDRGDLDVCFVWLSIGKGDLHIQSRDSLKKIFDLFPRVVLAEEAFAGGRFHIIKHEVVVVNWEKIRAQTDGEWTNKLMRDGEKWNLRDVLENTHREGRKMILIIDESHIGKYTIRTEQLLAVFNADVTIEVSATPKIEANEQDYQTGKWFSVFITDEYLPTEIPMSSKHVHIRIDPKMVIDEGMIKKELIINEDIAKIAQSEDDSQAAVLEAAYRKRLELKKAFAKEGSDINPLVLVQIPTAEAGEQKIEAVKKFLANKNIVERKDGHGNGKLAVWLAEQKSELIDWIAEPDNEIEFLIFKQAIDTGWDCPRAHILVKFRETHNIVFEIQTVGRILRMPEQHHYANEILNRGYIYTNLQSIAVKKEEYNPNIIKHLRAERIKGYKSIKLESYYKARADYGDVTSSFHKVFENAADDYFGTSRKRKPIENTKAVESKGVDLSVRKYLQEIIADTNVDVKDFDELEGRLDTDALAKLQVAADELMLFFEQTIKNNLGPFKNVKRSVPSVKAAIYIWFKAVLGSEEWGEDDMFMSQRIFMNNKNLIHFQKVLSSAVDIYVSVKEQEIKGRIEESEQIYPFELRPELFYNEYADEIVKVGRYAYDPCYLNIDRSAPERKFETFLDDNSLKIDWWWKNGENKLDYFGIKYEYQNTIYTFYPDYLVRFKDGRIAILEVKETNDRDGLSYTKAKAEALQKYIKRSGNKNLFGGIVIERSGSWLFNEKSKYDWDKCEKGDWSDWMALRLRLL